MAYNVLVVDDDTLMRPGLAVHLEQIDHRRSRVASVEDALALIQDYPPEAIFLTARRTKLDQVLRPELGADDPSAEPFDLDALLARVKAAIAAHLAPVAARWRQVWVPAMFALGVLLLALAAPQWIGWVQNVAASELPGEETVRGWLTNLLFDPVTAFNSLFSGAVSTWLNPGGQIGALVTLAIIVLAVASAAGLAQLLSHPCEGFEDGEVRTSLQE